MNHVPIRAPPRTSNLNERPPADQLIMVPLEQLWIQLPSQTHQDVLQRLTLMIVQQLALSQADPPREATDE